MRRRRFELVRHAALLVVAACGAGGATPGTAHRPPTAAIAASIDDQQVPLDAEIRRGVLDNGVTYYVMKHAQPERRAALWLLVNAGSVNEDDDQRGVAHLVEHLAFDGTRRFPRQAIIDFTERAGGKFGADLNARTSFDETVYQLSVPTDHREVLLEGLDLLRDWASEVRFDPAELARERGVVLDEWRLGRGAVSRIKDQQWPVIVDGSRYATRLPIGLPDVIQGAARDRLVEFYRDWYRPHDLAVVVVGDFDPGDVERAIARRFADLVEPATTRPRPPTPVPNDRPLAVTIARDRELSVARLAIYDKLGHRPETTRRDVRRTLAERLYHTMLDARLAELAHDPAAPFVSAGSSTGGLTRTCDAFVRIAQPKPGRAADTLAVLMREVARIDQHGFSAGELSRARATLLADFENGAREWDKAPGRLIAEEIARNFFDGAPVPDRRWALATARVLLPGITLDELAHLARDWGGARGRVIALSAPATDALPSEADLRAVAADAAVGAVEPWQDVTPGKIDAPPGSLEQPPVPGKVVGTARDEAADATVWTLGNGVRVVVKPTAFKNDEVQLEGWQHGGTSLLSDRDYAQVRFAADIVAASGAGALDDVALRQRLAGKIASVRVQIAELDEHVSAAARPADLETALQLLHLRLTAPRRDERAFAAWKERQRAALGRRAARPEVAFADQMIAVASGDHPRRRPVDLAQIDQIDLDRALALYRDRLSDLGDFTFVIVGNVDLTTLRPLVETYLGSLPAHGRKEHWKDLGIRYPTGKLTKIVTAGIEDKSRVELEISSPAAWSREAARDAAVLTAVLQIRLREVLREQLSGVYSVRANARLVREPVARRSLTISFTCDPARVDALIAAALGEVHEIARRGVAADYTAKVAAQLRREHEAGLETNTWWRIHLRRAYEDQEPITIDLAPVLARVTSDRIQATARVFGDDRNLIVGILRPDLTVSPTPATPAEPPAPPEPDEP